MWCIFASHKLKLKSVEFQQPGSDRTISTLTLVSASLPFFVVLEEMATLFSDANIRGRVVFPLRSGFFCQKVCILECDFVFGQNVCLVKKDCETLAFHYYCRYIMHIFWNYNPKILHVAPLRRDFSLLLQSFSVKKCHLNSGMTGISFSIIDL